MPAPDLTGQAPSIPLEEAIAIVDGWTDGYGPFPLHQVARALRRGLAERDKRIVDLADGLEQARTLWGIAVDSRVKAQQEADDLLYVATVQRQQAEEDATRLGTLRRENDELRRELEERREMAIELQLDADAQRALYRREEARADKLQADYDKLAYQSRMMGLALVDNPDNYKSLIEHYTLQRSLDLMEVWRPEVERWGLHQMCRVLRREYEEAVAEIENLVARQSAAVLAYDAAQQRALAAIPCARAKDSCPCPDYRWAPCCNLRVAMWAGEPFETDPLPESGGIHLFHPTTGNEPRKSAGCVKLFEYEPKRIVPRRDCQSERV